MLHVCHPSASVQRIRTIIADADLDGTICAALLLACAPDATVIFTRAAQVRAGEWDDHIDAQTAICDLPLRPGCGVYIDHHASNEPTEEQRLAIEARGGVCVWAVRPSAAQLAWEATGGHAWWLRDVMPQVDAIDAGTVDPKDVLADSPLMALSRCLSLSRVELMQDVARHLSSGGDLRSLCALPRVARAIAHAQQEQARILAILPSVVSIHDRFAVARFEDTGLKPPGYLVSAWLGDAADACCVVHRRGGRLGASFYTNQHGARNRRDLRTLDPRAGGHADACGLSLHNDDPEQSVLRWRNAWRRVAVAA